MRLPLAASWQLVSGSGADEHASKAPPRGGRQDSASVFSLPGEQDLSEFADLIGGGDEGKKEPQAAEEPAGIPFALPALLPTELGRPVTLRRTVDFGALHGERAQLHFSMLLGRGEVLLGGERLAGFDDGPLCLDVTAALRSAKRATLALRFDTSGGVLGPIWLQVSRYASLLAVHILPDADGRTVRVRASVLARHGGEYLLRCIFIEKDGQTHCSEAPFTPKTGEECTVESACAVSAPRFAAGEPCVMPCVRVQLWLRCAHCGAQPGALCDEQTLSFALGARAPRCFLPVTAKACRVLPSELASRLAALHVPCVKLSYAYDTLLLELTRRGVFALVTGKDTQSERLARFACAVVPKDGGGAPSIEDARLLAARGLCAMAAYPPAPPKTLDASQLLFEAAGLVIDPQATQTQDVLAWLRALLIRLRAEAMRQGALCGALCLPDEWEDEDVYAALETALSPLHLSALPLYGAWWTRTRFSAALHAFIPCDERGLTAEARLENEEGEVLALARSACPPGGGRLGCLEAALPDAPCVLTLHTRLLRGEIVAEQSAFPVYVGERGPLQCAFQESASQAGSLDAGQAESLGSAVS